jgi:hypothetical protein
VSKAQTAVVETAKAGFEGAKSLAENVGGVLTNTAKAGMEGVKDLATSAGTTVSDAVSTLTGKARKKNSESETCTKEKGHPRQATTKTRHTRTKSGRSSTRRS